VRKLRPWVWLLLLPAAWLPARPAAGAQAPAGPLIVSEGEEVVLWLGGDAPQVIARVPGERLVLPLFEVFVTLSPDGRYATYVTAEGATPHGISLHDATLWLVGLEAGAPQTGAPQTGAPQTGAPQTGAPETGGPEPVGSEPGSPEALVHWPENLWPAPLLWSPDSAYLAFVQGGHAPPDAVAGPLELWVVDLAGRRATRLSADPSFHTGLFAQALPPGLQWTADGQALVYTAYDPAAGLKVVHTVALHGGAHSRQAWPLSAAERQALQPQASLPRPVPRFSQADPRWSAQVMQTCALTIGRAGCALTSTAMVFGYYGVATDPGLLNACLGRYACPIYWGTASSSCSAGRVRFAEWPAFSWAKMEAELAQGRPPILYLCKYGDCQQYTHFVVVVSGQGTTAAGYRIHDPSDGTPKPLSAYTSAQWQPQSLRVYQGTITYTHTVHMPLIVKRRR
jgi:hypothetical protein